MAGSAGVTPAYVGLEPTLILPIDPPRAGILPHAATPAARTPPRAPAGPVLRDVVRQSTALTAITATPMASGSWM